MVTIQGEKTMAKRIVTFILSAVMIISLIPASTFTAYADEAYTDSGPAEETELPAPSEEPAPAEPAAAPVEPLTDKSGYFGYGLYWYFNSSTGEMTISGTGKIEDFQLINNSYPNTPWRTYRKQIRSLVISDGVTSIGSYAFYNCESLTSAVIGTQL